MNKSKKVLVHFRFNRDLREDLMDLSNYYEVSQTSLVEEGLRLYFKDYHGEELMEQLRIKRKQGIEQT